MIGSKQREEKPMAIYYRKWLIWIIVISICVRLLSMIILRSWHSDKSYYGSRDGAIGSALASGLGFSWPSDKYYNPTNSPKPTAWQPPIYPLIIGCVFKVFGIYSIVSKVILMILQTIISALICLVIFLIGRITFNMWVGLFASLMAALYPSALHFTIEKVSSINLIVFLLLLLIFQFFKIVNTPDMKKNILAGIIIGIALLCDPTVAAFLPFALVWLFHKQQAELKARIIHMALILLAACITVAPWQIRNRLVLGQFVFIKSNFSRELFLGNYGRTRSFEEERQYMEIMDEGQRNKLYNKKAVNAIVSNPGKLIHQTFRRFVHYWTDTPFIHSRTGKTYGTNEQVIGISYMILLILGLTGLFLTHLRGKEIQLLVIAILSLPLPYYLTWFERFRYRFPVELILMVFASYTIFKFCKWMKIYMPE